MAYQLSSKPSTGQAKKLAQRINAKLAALDAAVVKSVTLAKDATAQEGFAASYTLSVNGTDLPTKINIPKDYLVKSGDVKTVTTADTPVAGYKVGDKYLDFVVNAKDGSATDSHIYINVKDLIDIYLAGNGINIAADNTISVVVDANSANGLSVGANGIALGLATDSAAGAMSATDHAQFTADSAKLANISVEANKTTVSTEKAGTIEIDGITKTIVEFATDAEFDEMLDEVFGAENNGE